MGGFAAKFRGFWAGRGCGEAIQRTADGAGCSGRKIFKNFLERGGNPKNWSMGGAGRWSGRTLYRVRGVIFGSGNEISSSVARAGVRRQRFTPLIYGESVY